MPRLPTTEKEPAVRHTGASSTTVNRTRAFCLRRNVKTVVRYFFGPCAVSHGREAWNRRMADGPDCSVPLEAALPAWVEPPDEAVSPVEAATPVAAVPLAAPEDPIPASPGDGPP